jgi:hypothetical protein
MDIFYCGDSPGQNLCQAVAESGHKIVPLQYKRGALANVPGCAAVVLHWKSKWGQRVIREAKTAGLPILVVTSKLAAAVRAGKPSADLYLEEPVTDRELAGFLADFVTAKNRQCEAAASVEAGRW